MSQDVASLRRATGAVRCVACGKCTSTCPLCADGRFSARVIADGSGADQVEESGLIGRCLTCGACELTCPQGIRFTDYVRGLRSLQPDPAPGPCPHGGTFQCVSRAMAGSESVRRDRRWLDPDLQIAEEGEVGYFVGCLPFFAAYFGRRIAARPLDIARAAIRLLNHLGIRPVLVDEERCCGHDLLWSGDTEAFAALARGNAEAFAARGVKTLVTTCAECCRTWRVDMPEAVPGFRPQVLHMAELVARELQAGKVRFRDNGGGTLTFQDPCRLARHLGVTDAPRHLLGALPGKRLVEMDRYGRQADCCGTSGFIFCDRESRRMQSRRLAAAGATGADTLVTACPKCQIHFACAQAEDRARGAPRPGPVVEDLTVVAAAMLDDKASNTAHDSASRRRTSGDKT